MTEQTPCDEVQYVSDAEKVMFLGTMLLAVCMTHDPDVGVYETEEGRLIASVVVDPAARELAQAYFEREGAKAESDLHAEIVVGWGFDDIAKDMYVRFDVENPDDVPVNRAQWLADESRRIPEVPNLTVDPKEEDRK